MLASVPLVVLATVDVVTVIVEGIRFIPVDGTLLIPDVVLVASVDVITLV